MHPHEHEPVDRGALCVSVLLWGCLLLWGSLLVLFWFPILRAVFS